MPSEWGARAMTRNGLRPPAAPITLCAPSPVRARIVWTTGEQLVDCVATAWARECVRVEMPERAIVLWLAASDVTRR
jgi:hypothetical protein